MNRFNSDFLSALITLAAGVYIIVVLAFIRAFYWCLPILLVWNKIIVGLTGFSPMTYWNAYWTCLVFMTVISASVAVKSKSN